MKRILVAFASKHGSTAEVAAAVARRIALAGHHVDTLPASQVIGIDDFDGVVLGGPIYLRRWHADARHFLEHNAEAFQRVPLAVFAMGPLTTGDVDMAATRADLDAALARRPGVEPLLVTVFGGVVDPANLPFPFNRMQASDARDWTAIDAWADEVAAAFAVAHAHA